MKILIYGEYYKRASGYSRAVKDLLPHLAKDNTIAHIGLGFNGFPPDTSEYLDRVYPGKDGINKKYWALESLAYALEAFEPDIVLTLSDYFATRKYAFPLSHPGPWKWVHWGTLDADPLGYDCRESIRWIDYNFYFSEFAKREIEKVVPQIHGEVLYPATNPKTFNVLEDRDEKRERYLLKEKKVILTCGRNQQRKNIPILLDALEILKDRMKDLVLILASNTQTETDSGELDGYNYDNFIKDRKLQNRVISPYSKTGKPISDRLLNVMYNLADLQVQQSWGEGFCMPLAEGFATELPAIGVNHSAIPEVIGNRGELVEPAVYSYNPDGGRYYMVSPEVLADKIEEMFSKPKKMKEYGKRGKKWVAKFTPEKQAEQMLSAFRRVIDEDINCVAIEEYVKGT